jgi:hypothetical protein
VLERQKEIQISKLLENKKIPRYVGAFLWDSKRNAEQIIKVA